MVTTTRPIIMQTFTHVTKLHRRFVHQLWYTPADLQSVVVLGSKPHSHTCHGNRTCTSSYVSCSRSPKMKYQLAASSKFFKTFNSGHKLLNVGAEERLCKHCWIHTSNSMAASPSIVQNSRCKSLEITIDTLTFKIPFIWLRDHCRSEKYYNHKTSQKNVDSDILTKDLTPASVGLTDSQSGIRITWKDGHVTEFSFKFLADNFYPGYLSCKTPRLMWDKAVIQSQSLPAVSYNDHVTTELGLQQSLANLVKFGFVFVEGTPASAEATQKVAERISFIYETIFGRMWTLTSNASRSDTAYTTQRLGAHTDNTYMSTPAGIQVFHCLEYSRSGGETLLVDGFKAASTLQRSDPSAFQVLSKTVVPHEYKESSCEASPGYHLYSLGTVVSTHPASGELLQIRYNPYDCAPLNTVEPENIERFYEAYDKLSRIITNPDSELWIKLKPGSVLLIDNWRVLHGRAEFSGKRVLCGCYLPRDEWTSKARLMGVL